MERLFLVQVGGALAIVIATLFAGCSTSNIGTSVTEVPSASPAPEIKPVAPATSVATKPRTNAPAPIVKCTPSTAAAAPAPEPPPIHGWVGIDHWALANGGRVRTVATGAQPKLELIAPAGRLEFSVGSQVAKWNGENFLLGFAPQISHEVSVNGLDISKSFIPLLYKRPTTLHGRTIVIDPGHGGDQRGAKSVVSKQFEKDFTLDWARRLQTLLASNGWHVYLTRTNDSDIPLQDRVAVAERVNADLFVSLHFNSGGTAGSESGVETYCMTPFGMPSNLTRGYVDDPFYNWPNNAYDRENFTWAMRLHRAIIGELKANDRGVRRARFMAVLRTQRRPAVLIEGGYLSNQHEATLINMPDYRQKLAQAVADGLGAFPKQ